MPIYTTEDGILHLIDAVFTAVNGNIRQVQSVYSSRFGRELMIFEPGRMLWEYEPGELLYLPENGMPTLYRVWEKDYLRDGSVLVVREQALPEPMAFSRDGNWLYEGSDADVFLTETFAARFSQEVRGWMRTADIPVLADEDGDRRTLARSVFLLSDGELGGTSGEGEALSWYRISAGRSGAEEARLCRTAAGSAPVRWHLRTPSLPFRTELRYNKQVRSDGIVVGTLTTYSSYLRPALVLDELCIPEDL